MWACGWGGYVHVIMVEIFEKENVTFSFSCNLWLKLQRKNAFESSERRNTEPVYEQVFNQRAIDFRTKFCRNRIAYIFHCWNSIYFLSFKRFEFETWKYVRYFPRLIFLNFFLQMNSVIMLNKTKHNIIYSVRRKHPSVENLNFPSPKQRFYFFLSALLMLMFSSEICNKIPPLLT